MRSLGVRERSLEEALSLGPLVLQRAEEDRAPWAAASVITATAPAVVLGALQRAGRVLDLDACARAGTLVLRRHTTGTAAYVGARAIVWTLALPNVSALFPDATARTLLNRNVRPFLRGLKAAGLAAQYFGREWVAVRHAPAALVGFDVAFHVGQRGGERAGAGAVLIEVIAGYDEPIAIPDALKAPLERETERWRGKAPLALADSGTAERSPQSPDKLAQLVLEAIAQQAGAALAEASLDLSYAARSPAAIRDPQDPAPPGLTLLPPLRVPIGWIDIAARLDANPGQAWVGGDVLAPRWLFEEAARAYSGDDGAAAALDNLANEDDIAIEGATIRDLRAAVGS